MKNLPLLFSFNQVVLGDGFVAGVRVNGRALLEEGEETWISGVATVGFAAGGADRGVAFTEFRNAWMAVLFDIAEESASFEAFEQACTEFLSSRVSRLSAEWDAALAEVRRLKFVDPTLKREDADDQPPSFEVVDLTHLAGKSKENQIETGLKAAA